jgi:hypothetical protein
MAFEAMAPEIETPISEIAPLPSFLVARIAIAAIMVPHKLKSATYEKRVPDTIDMPTTFAAANTINHLKGRMSTASRIGKFAMPIRIKGRGFGNIYSIADKKKQKAASKAVSSA